MIIPYDKTYTNPYHAIICESIECKFRRECANHCSAGDFRSEDGFSPKLTIENGQVNCETYHSSVINSISYTNFPKEYNSMRRGIVCWKNVVEKIDMYDI